MIRPRHILFIGEAVTLAHVSRPVALAAGLDVSRYTSSFAWAPHYDALLGELPGARYRIDSISPASFVDRLRRGQPLYSYDTLRRYVQEDLAILEQAQPDVVVGDFRLSLSVSARKYGIPYLALGNAYWMPAAQARWEIPSHPLARWLGPAIGTALFRATRRAIFAVHSIPMARLRRQYGLPSLGYDLRRVYTDADTLLLADMPELIPSRADGVTVPHTYIGPVFWSPDGPVPDAVDSPPPLIYVCMGSSGQQQVNAQVLDALEQIDCRALIVAPEGLWRPHPRFKFAKFVNGSAAAAKAAVVVCNGGSPACYQAFAQGVPVLGLPDNLDQYLNMQYVEQFGAGLKLRADRATSAQIRNALRRLIGAPEFAERAGQLRRATASYDSSKALARIVDATLGA